VVVSEQRKSRLMVEARQPRDLFPIMAVTGVVAVIGAVVTTHPDASPFWVGLYVVVLLECVYLHARLLGIAHTAQASGTKGDRPGGGHRAGERGRARDDRGKRVAGDFAV
jgi:hypothetical protein